MVTMRIEFIDGKVMHVNFTETDQPDTMYAWHEGVNGLVLKAHFQVNRMMIPWANIRSYAIHNDEVEEYRHGARAAPGK